MRMLGKHITMSALLIAWCCNAYGEDGCVSTRTVDIENCVSNRLSIADARLNLAYNKLINRLPGPDIEKLRATQRLWIKYRKDECAPDKFEGAEARIEIISCELNLILYRLNNLLEFVGQGYDGFSPAISFIRDAYEGGDESATIARIIKKMPISRAWKEYVDAHCSMYYSFFPEMKNLYPGREDRCYAKEIMIKAR